MKYTRTLMAAAAALMIAGCGPTMPVKADAEQAPQPNPPGTLASVRRGGMAEKTAKCEAYVKRGSLI